MTNYSLEALSFQKSSQIGQALEKVFQKAIDFRDSIDFDLQIKEVNQYCRNTLKQDLIKIYKDILNVNIENVIFIKDKWPSATFAIAIYIGNNNEKSIIENTVYGLQKITSPTKEMNEIFDIYKLVDTDTGSMSNNRYNDKEVFAVLYFDISAGLLLNHYVPVELVEPLTAQELAAMYLHETGHFFSIIDRARYRYFVNERINKQLLNLCDKYDSIEVINEFNNHKNELLDKVKETKDKDLLNKFTKLDKVISTVHYLSEKKEECQEKDYPKIALIITLLTKCMFYVIYDIFFALLVGPFTNILDEYDSSKELLSHTKKVSDQIVTKKHKTAFEKDADEYTVRSGYANYQISCLSKLEKLFTYLYTISNIPYVPDYNLTKVSMKVIEYITIMTMFEKYSIYTTSPSGKYEHGLARNKRLCQMCISALKHTDPIIRYEYLSKYERAIDEMNKLEKFADNPLRKIDNFISTIINAPSVFIDNLLTGRVNKEYFKLQEQVEEIVNNKLYYYGNKFKSFLK